MRRSQPGAPSAGQIRIPLESALLHRRLIAIAAIAALPLAGASVASAATLTVDDDHGDCPAAGYVSVQAAVDAAAPNDVIVICPGAYAEGSGAPATNALTIDKPLTLKGAGADLVTISPRATSLSSSTIAQPTANVRSGVGDIVAITGLPRVPIAVNISGVTVSGEDAQGRAIASDAGIVFLDATGSVNRSRVTNVVTSEGATAYGRVGGWRSATPAYGIVQTSATDVGIPGERVVRITNTRVDRYNVAGILIDGATNDTAPFLPSGVTNKGVVSGSQVVGRVECANFEADGSCSNVGLLTTGPLFGQDGIRVTNNSRVAVTDSLLSQNLVNGTGAPVRTTWVVDPSTRIGSYVAANGNNANLRLAAGIRLLGASLTNYSSANGQTIYSSATRSNITDNGYGVLNVAADGVTDQVGTPTSTARLGNVFKAENNWWGLGYYRTTNAGPEIAPANNTPFPENPVNGVSAPDGTGSTSTSVDIFPYRNGSQGDGFNGQFAIIDAPMPVNDAAPEIALSTDATAATGAAVTLTAAADDDFGVKRVTFYDAGDEVGSATLPPYEVPVTVPADAVCDTTRSYSAMVEDSLGQTTASAPVTVTVRCAVDPGRRDPDPDPGRRDPDPDPGRRDPDPGNRLPDTRLPDTRLPDTTPPAAPTVTLGTVAKTLGKSTTVTFTPTAAAGFASAKVMLGSRTVCTVTKAPFSCAVKPTGADVGSQVLRVVVTDARGSTAEALTSVTVPKFAAKLKATVKQGRAKRGKVKRTIRVALALPAGVTAAQGCSSGHVTLAVKRGGRTVINEQVVLKGSCTITRSVTASRGGSFTLSAKFGGNAVLRSASTSRRFT